MSWLSVVKPYRLPFPPTAELLFDQRSSRRIDQCIDELVAHSQSELNPFLPFKVGRNVDEHRSALILGSAGVLSNGLVELNQLFVGRTSYVEKLTHSKSAAVRVAALEEFEKLVAELGATIMQMRVMDVNAGSRVMPKFYFGMNCVIGFGIPDNLKRYPLVFDDAALSVEERTWAVLFALRALDFYVSREPSCEPLLEPTREFVVKGLGPDTTKEQERQSQLLLLFDAAVARKDDLILRPLKHCTDVFRVLVDNPTPQLVTALRQAWTIGLAGVKQVWR
jgi:hypothetical protein